MAAGRLQIISSKSKWWKWPERFLQGDTHVNDGLKAFWAVERCSYLWMWLPWQWKETRSPWTDAGWRVTYPIRVCSKGPTAPRRGLEPRLRPGLGHSGAALWLTLRGPCERFGTHQLALLFFINIIPLAWGGEEAVRIYKCSSDRFYCQYTPRHTSEGLLHNQVIKIYNCLSCDPLYTFFPRRRGILSEVLTRSHLPFLWSRREQYSGNPSPYNNFSRTLLTSSSQSSRWRQGFSLF